VEALAGLPGTEAIQAADKNIAKKLSVLVIEFPQLKSFRSTEAAAAPASLDSGSVATQPRILEGVKKVPMAGIGCCCAQAANAPVTNVRPQRRQPM
jgi:hypothetical protein